MRARMPTARHCPLLRRSPYRPGRLAQPRSEATWRCAPMLGQGVRDALRDFDAAPGNAATCAAKLDTSPGRVFCWLTSRPEENVVTDFETALLRKVAWRLVPFLCIGYVINP